MSKYHSHFKHRKNRQNVPYKLSLHSISLILYVELSFFENLFFPFVLMCLHLYSLSFILSCSHLFIYESHFPDIQKWFFCWMFLSFWMSECWKQIPPPYKCLGCTKRRLELGQGLNLRFGLRLATAVCSHVSATNVSETFTKLEITISISYRTGTVCKKCIAWKWNLYAWESYLIGVKARVGQGVLFALIKRCPGWVAANSTWVAQNGRQAIGSESNNR